MSSLAGYIGGRRPQLASQSFALLQKRKRKRIERRIGHLLAAVRPIKTKVLQMIRTHYACYITMATSTETSQRADA